MINSFPVVPSCVPGLFPVELAGFGCCSQCSLFSLCLYTNFSSRTTIKINREHGNSGNNPANQRVGHGTQWEPVWNSRARPNAAVGFIQSSCGAIRCQPIFSWMEGDFATAIENPAENRSAASEQLSTPCRRGVQWAAKVSVGRALLKSMSGCRVRRQSLSAARTPGRRGSKARRGRDHAD
jgi:hypothetical protein